MPAPGSDSGELPPAGRNPIGVGSRGEAPPLQRVPPVGIINSPVPRGAINMCMAGGSGGPLPESTSVPPPSCPPAQVLFAHPRPRRQEASSRRPHLKAAGISSPGRLFALGPGELMRC